MPMPRHVFLSRSEKQTRAEMEADDKFRPEKVLAKLAHGRLHRHRLPRHRHGHRRLAYTWADKLVTPMNDSFVDLDVVANVDGGTHEIVRPSVYSEMVWEA